MPQTTEIIRFRKGGLIRNVWEGITSWFGRASSTLITMWGTREVYPDINSEKAITEGFNSSLAVYAIVNCDANKFASIPRFLYDAKKLKEYKTKGYGGKETIANDLSKLLERPNPKIGQAAFFKLIRCYYKVCGEAFIWLNRGEIEPGMKDNAIDLKPVLELYVLPSYMVNIIPDAEDLWGVEGYLLNVGGRKIYYRKNDIIHWKSVNLSFSATTRDHLHGMPPLRPGESTLQQNKDATRSSVRQYQNDGAKGVLFSDVKTLNPTQESQIRGVVDSRINNNEAKGMVATLQGKWDYVNLGSKSIDMELLKGKSMTWQELCFLFEVPYEFFDSTVTYENKLQAQKNWVNNSIIPASKELDDELNRVLLKAFILEGKALIASDASELPELQEDMTKMIEGLDKAWYITPNQKLVALGHEPRAEKEMDEPWIGNKPLSKILAEKEEGDDFDKVLADLGITGDYKKPEVVNGQQNGKKN